MAMVPNKILGIQAASKGGKLPLVEKVRENLSMTTNIAAVIMPVARWRPLPPRVLREATETPIKVRINTDTGVASRR